MVGDITILANRSHYVDFSLPFMEPGVYVIVPLKNDERKNAWIFTKPLTMGLWLTTGAFFVFTGLVIWILEHRTNDEFRGPIGEQVGKIFWFSFSTLVFAHSKCFESYSSSKKHFFFHYDFNSYVYYLLQRRRSLATYQDLS